MESNQTKSILQVWLTALQQRQFRIKFVITLALLIACAITAPVIFQFIQQREGSPLNDFFLALLPTVDLSDYIFFLLYVLIVAGVISLSYNPTYLLMALQGYTLLTVLRFFTLLLVPLEPPLQMAELKDPFVQELFYQQIITKDLFFSGHTSIMVLLTLSTRHKVLKGVLLLGTCLIAVMLLLQHAHYTIDILAAPFFAWLAWRTSNALNQQ